ncbi:DHHC palmitoyltransferase-domain-containing protein [Lipomyces tetrasporus]|uniref:Palmitoyltransferase n=1 Tax=Lipomyces tetrasporus TaxID=54092 RepID=A0AAD7QPA1_9ASCO|nr:DHHC palmitoyltransferase-domain-containing protein [Lipomyces tetrasporus]KAJ8098808.1 DHHC palmitoyltransferase-domain-containing protein [Lipomyces tetrasporus]
MKLTALHYVVAFIVVFSTIVFIVLFGRLPAFKGTIVGKAHVLLWHKIPARLIAIDKIVTGGRFCNATSSAGNYLVNEKNWAVTTFYITILTVALVFFFKDAWRYITNPIHRLLIPPLALQPYFYLYLCAFTDPGTITQSNVSRMLDLFPYDDIIFYPDMPPCRTCHTPKPARSKHCSVCKRCVARMDHHCAWINNCVGYYNYRYFLGFIVSNLIVLVYGSYLTFSVLYMEYMRQYFPEGYEKAPKYFWADYPKWIRLVHSQNWTAAVSSLFMIATLVCPLVVAFLAQHILFIHQGVTTNESEKWGEVEWIVNNGMLYIYEIGNAENETAESASGSGSENEPGSARPRSAVWSRDKAKTDNSGRRVYIHVYEDGEMNRSVPQGMIQTDKVPDLESVENIYDKGGVFRNWREVFFPKYT